ncbi:MAG: RNA polymerase sigma factor [Clostridium sp.]|nr:RNA polymerase sigma factor [Clostridium sp.]MCM1171625.1 RNA polymerase sigma factor [Clostridium sp.]MCM1207884.1 RNA polymerase sigma factor [Ruminococcus sp.]
MTDEEFTLCLDLVLKGDKEGLRKIYEAYIKLIYAVVYNAVGRREDAEDITSEFFIKLIHAAKSFKKGSPHKTWLVTIAKNMSIDFLRKNGREILVDIKQDDTEQSEDAIDKVAHSKNAVQKGAGDESFEVENKAVLAEDMRQALETLSPKEREIVHMKLLGELRFKDIAEATKQPMGTVTWLYNQGIKKLRRCLSGYEKE